MGFGGEATYVNFGFEETFKTAVTANKTFGHDVRLRRASARNTLRRIMGLSSRNAQKLNEGPFEGALEIEFFLASPWFLRAVSGTVSSTGGGPYTHTFGEADQPPSMTVEQGYDQDTDYVRKYIGVIVTQCRIDAQTGEEPARVTLSCLYANETLNATTLGSQVAETEEVFNFALADFQIPNATSVADTDNASITITNTAALRHALGSRVASRYRMGERLHDVETTNYFNDPTQYLARTYAGSTADTTVGSSITEIPSVTLEFDNAAATTSQREYKFLYTGVKIEEHDLPASIDDDLMERVTMMARSLSIEVVNNTANPP